MYAFSVGRRIYVNCSRYSYGTGFTYDVHFRTSLHSHHASAIKYYSIKYITVFLILEHKHIAYCLNYFCLICYKLIIIFQHTECRYTFQLTIFSLRLSTPLPLKVKYSYYYSFVTINTTKYLFIVKDTILCLLLLCSCLCFCILSNCSNHPYAIVHFIYLPDVSFIGFVYE